MGKKLIAPGILTAILLASCLPCQPQADTGITITANSTQHTVVMPYEKSFRFVATIKNNGNTTKKITTQCDKEKLPAQWHLLTTTGQYELRSGQSIDYIAVFEPGAGPGGEAKEETFTAPISFSWDGGEKKLDVTVKTKMLPFKDLKKSDLSKVEITVLDQSTNQAISGAVVLAMLPSGIERQEASQTEGGYTLSLPSGTYLERIIEEYQIDHTSTGYYLQVSARGYKSYFESNYLPKDGDTKPVKLEPLNKVAEYDLEKTVKSGYSIWWIRASADEKYFAFSQGAHGRPGEEPPDKTKVLMTSDGGNVLWEKQTGGECWGADISPDENYVSAGCHDGNIYLWDKEGNEVWKYSNGKGGQVRWVEFSPNNKYLLSGPVNGSAEQSGLFNVKTGKLLWSFFTGDWLREGTFSSDSKTTYFSSGNGTVYAVETASGKIKWLGSGDHAIPFILDLDEQDGFIVSAGKGRAFTALNLSNGKKKWQTVVDQTVTAAKMANNGSAVGATVGGMAYGVADDGTLTWMRNHGGVGHNGVHYTQNGNYVLLGGPNPTLFDSDGNVLWQREKDKKIEMTGPVEQDTGGANAVWVSNDGSLIILGGDEGKITFYRGEVKQGTNKYSQLTGPMMGEEVPLDGKDTTDRALPNWTPWLLAAGLLGIGVIIGAVQIIRRRRSY